MPHTIAVRDQGGITANDYKLVFSGDVEPEFVEKHGATPSPNAQIYETNNGDRAVVNAVWGGTDVWTYGGQMVWMALRRRTQLA